MPHSILSKFICQPFLTTIHSCSNLITLQDAQTPANVEPGGAAASIHCVERTPSGPVATTYAAPVLLLTRKCCPLGSTRGGSFTPRCDAKGLARRGSRSAGSAATPRRSEEGESLPASLGSPSASHSSSGRSSSAALLPQRCLVRCLAVAAAQQHSATATTATRLNKMARSLASITQLPTQGSDHTASGPSCTHTTSPPKPASHVQLCRSAARFPWSGQGTGKHAASTKRPDGSHTALPLLLLAPGMWPPSTWAEYSCPVSALPAWAR